jgi:hypothetical protein
MTEPIKPEALRLADALEKDHLHTIALDMDAAAELRRLHAEVERLREVAELALEALDSDHPYVQLRAALALRAALKEMK